MEDKGQDHPIISQIKLNNVMDKPTETERVGCRSLPTQTESRIGVLNAEYAEVEMGEVTHREHYVDGMPPSETMSQAPITTPKLPSLSKRIKGKPTASTSNHSNSNGSSRNSAPSSRLSSRIGSTSASPTPPVATTGAYQSGSRQKSKTQKNVMRSKIAFFLFLLAVAAASGGMFTAPVYGASSPEDVRVMKVLR